MKDMKNIYLLNKNKQTLHIETPLGIINITTNLHDIQGRKVDSIEVIPNSDYSGEHKVTRRGLGNTRLVQLKRLNK